jgi:hypothetical protein
MFSHRFRRICGRPAQQLNISDSLHVIFSHQEELLGSQLVLSSEIEKITECGISIQAAVRIAVYVDVSSV